MSINALNNTLYLTLISSSFHNWIFSSLKDRDQSSEKGNDLILKYKSTFAFFWPPKLKSAKKSNCPFDYRPIRYPSFLTEAVKGGTAPKPSNTGRQAPPITRKLELQGPPEDSCACAQRTRTVGQSNWWVGGRGRDEKDQRWQKGVHRKRLRVI